jgi:hypothetical protein
LARSGDLLAIIAATLYLLRSAKQDLLRNGGLIRDVEKRFANLGSDMGSRQLNRKLETSTLLLSKTA